ncbi:MAG: hypothetical protein NT154_17510, partial [Verrucomicrobia bacterium]|nr:hypothetical protein [Verrucomicrobiota bacterium]
MLKCSRGANQIALTILDVDQIVFDTYASMIDPSVFVLLNNPAPLFGHIRFYQYDTWMDSGVRKYRPASGDMYVWGLRKRTNGKWFWSGVQPFGDPTPHAVRSIYNP